MGRPCVLLMAMLVGSVACGTLGEPDRGRVADGTWGGDHIRLAVTATSATTEYDCAHGTIDQPLMADRDGRLSVTGTHTFEHGGPIRVDESADRHPARYEGRLIDDTLQLTVTITDTQQTLGTFTVKRGAAPRLLKCL